jgi:hypothetical protein
MDHSLKSKQKEEKLVKLFEVKDKLRGRGGAHNPPSEPSPAVAAAAAAVSHPLPAKQKKLHRMGSGKSPKVAASPIPSKHDQSKRPEGTQSRQESVAQVTGSMKRNSASTSESSETGSVSLSEESTESSYSYDLEDDLSYGVEEGEEEEAAKTLSSTEGSKEKESELNVEKITPSAVVATVPEVSSTASSKEDEGRGGTAYYFSEEEPGQEEEENDGAYYFNK